MGQQGARMNAEHAVTVASINLHCGHRPEGPPFDVTAACRSLDADVIALQETWTPYEHPDAVRALATALGYEAVQVGLLEVSRLDSLGVTGSDYSGSGKWGMALLTTLPITHYEIVDVGRAPGDITRRCAQLITCKTATGHSIVVANTHLTHRAFGSPVQLRRLVRGLGRQPHPVVIAGDLNMPGIATRVAAGYRRAVRGRTWPAHRPLTQLDHLLVNSFVAQASGRVLGPVGSDHLPIFARVCLPP